MIDNSYTKKIIDIHAPLSLDAEDIYERDILGRRSLAKRILARLQDRNCPATIGIYGGWGTGKTSLLNLIRREACEQNIKQIEIIEIDAWKYEGIGSLLIPVVVCLKKLAGNIALRASWQVITRRVFATAALSLVDAGLKKVAALDRDNLKENLQLVQQREKQNGYSAILLQWKDWTDDVEDTEKAFESIVNSICEHKGCSRLVLCVDNLDRCSPEAAVKLLESVKNFFSVPHCTWVFAIDSDVIASYIGKKYEGTAVNGYSFLDKIIPEQYHLSLSPSVENREIILNLIYAATGNRRTLDDPTRLPQVPRVIVPRRLIKSAQKYSEFFDKTPFDSGHDTVFVLILLYHSWPDFYVMLSSPSSDHIGRILANFFRESEETWDGYTPLPLTEKYKDNQELAYFLRQSFPAYRRTDLKHNALVNEIQLAIEGLRCTGLP